MSVLKRHLGARVGYKDGRPVYAFACPTREDGLERHLGLRIGYKDGRPVYAFTGCLPAWPKTLAMRAGYKDGRPLYFHGGDCCQPEGGSPSSNVSPTSSSSPGAEAAPTYGCYTCTGTNALPAVLTATFSNRLRCACLAGLSITLNYAGYFLGDTCDSGPYHKWEGQATSPCSSPGLGPVQVTLICNTATSSCARVVLRCGTPFNSSGTVFLSAGSTVCKPFFFQGTFNGFTDNPPSHVNPNCCDPDNNTYQVDITITE